MIWSLKLELKMTPGNTQTKGKTVNSSSAKVSSTQNDSLYKSLLISGCWLVENHTIWGWVVGCDWCMTVDCWIPTGSGPRNVDTHIVTLCCGWPGPATGANQYSSPPAGVMVGHQSFIRRLSSVTVARARYRQWSGPPTQDTPTSISMRLIGSD